MDSQIVKRADDRKDQKNSYVEYRLAGKGLAKFFGNKPQRGLIINLSKHGIAFRAVEPLAEKTQLPLTLILSGARQARLAGIKGEVRWCREEHKLGTAAYSHVIGVRITEFSPESWQTLNRLLLKEA
jgi:hypothetical protein